jgi:hypothetical protein
MIQLFFKNGNSMTRIRSSFTGQIVAVGIAFIDKTFQLWAVDRVVQKLFSQTSFYNAGSHWAVLCAILYPLHKGVKAPIGFYAAALYTVYKCAQIWGARPLAPRVRGAP